jgi:hypothetical protein
MAFCSWTISRCTDGETIAGEHRGIGAERIKLFTDEMVGTRSLLPLAISKGVLGVQMLILLDDEYEGETDLRASFCAFMTLATFIQLFVALALRSMVVAMGPADPDTFRNSNKASGLFLKNEGCAYMSVSAPCRTLANPYYTGQTHFVSKSIKDRNIGLL